MVTKKEVRDIRHKRHNAYFQQIFGDTISIIGLKNLMNYKYSITHVVIVQDW